MEGAIIEKFGWTLNYLLWKVSFARIQIMLADMPWYEYQKTESKPGILIATFNTLAAR